MAAPEVPRTKEILMLAKKTRDRHGFPYLSLHIDAVPYQPPRGSAELADT